MNTPSDISSINPQGPLLFYDGECGFCNGSVQFVLRHERAPLLMFAPLQGSTAGAVLENSQVQPDTGAGGTIVLLDKGELLVRSRAVVRAMVYMGGVWKVLSGILAVIPTPLADLVYRMIARFRRFIPSGDSCALLSPEHRRRFLP